MEQRAELPFFFADRRTPVMLEPIFLPLLLILAAMILGFCLILPGIRGRERIFAALRFFMLGSAGFWIFFRLVFFCNFDSCDLNPYWQILENSSSFPGRYTDRFLENSSSIFKNFKFRGMS